MPRICAGESVWECTAELSVGHPTGFCRACEDRLTAEYGKGWADLDQFARLAAEFDEYCRARGLRDPHS